MHVWREGERHAYRCVHACRDHHYKDQFILFTCVFYVVVVCVVPSVSVDV